MSTISNGNRAVAEHAAADLMTRGYWICPCVLCKTARATTTRANEIGLCQHCGKPLGTRMGARYCKVSCRVAACRKRGRQAALRAVPLFYPPAPCSEQNSSPSQADVFRGDNGSPGDQPSTPAIVG